MKGIHTHTYHEAIDTDTTFIKTGTKSFLWGLIVWPAGYYDIKTIHTLHCKHCAQLEFTPIHGHYKVNKL